LAPAALIVETDGERFHDNPLAFERDRKRDRILQLRGYRVVRFTHAQIEREPDAVVAAIRRLLAEDFG
jgi:very-short-patch-repair endonuclease